MALSPLSDHFYQFVLASNPSLLKEVSFQKKYWRTVFYRRALETLFVAALMNGAQTFTVSQGSPFLLPATGLGLSALFLRGRTILFGIFLGYALHEGLYQAILWTLTLFLIRETCLQHIGATIPLRKPKTLLAFTGISLFYLLFLPQTFAHLNGILYLTPLCLTLEPFALEKFLAHENRRAWIGAFMLFIVHGSLLFLPPHYLPAAMWILPFFVGLYAFYFPPIFVGLSLLILSTLILTLPYGWLSAEWLSLQACIALSISLYRAPNPLHLPSA